MSGCKAQHPSIETAHVVLLCCPSSLSAKKCTVELVEEFLLPGVGLSLALPTKKTKNHLKMCAKCFKKIKLL